jgi:hypothetical protein
VLDLLIGIVMVILIGTAFFTVIEDWIKAKKKDPSTTFLDQAMKGHDDPKEPTRWVP